MDLKARRFWTLVSFNLTIIARPDLKTENGGPLSVGYNELQHTILGLLAADPKDNGVWLIAILFEQANQYHLESSMSWAIESSAKVMMNPPS